MTALAHRRNDDFVEDIGAGEEKKMNETITYSVPGMSCDHCRTAITAEVSGVPGVQQVDVDLDTKLVAITGASLEDAALVAAIDEAGYEAVRAA